MFHLTTVEPATYQLLQQLFKFPVINTGFALAGGTSLSLQIGHRKSIDLDIFSAADFSVDELEIELRSSGFADIVVLNKNRRMLFTRINGIKCDFVQEPAKILEKYIKLENSFLYSMPDIGAMKLHTICGRGKRKDFFDIYCLLQQFTWEQLLAFFEQKYSSDQLYFLWRSILYFNDADDDFEIDGLGQFNVSWEKIKDYIITTCTEL